MCCHEKIQRTSRFLLGTVARKNKKQKARVSPVPLFRRFRAGNREQSVESVEKGFKDMPPLAHGLTLPARNNIMNPDAAGPPTVA